MTPSQIKKLRTAAELTQAEFAEVFGVTQATVSKWERGMQPGGAAEKLLDIFRQQWAQT